MKESTSVWESALVIRRRIRERYHAPLIATDLADAAVVAPFFELVDPGARIVLLGTYRIPFAGMHVIFGMPRLERELDVAAFETLAAFAQSTRLSPARFDLVTHRGDLREHVSRELRTRGCDVAVLAFERGTVLARHTHHRLVTQVLAETSCDVIELQQQRRELSRSRPVHGNLGLRPVRTVRR